MAKPRKKRVKIAHFFRSSSATFGGKCLLYVLILNANFMVSVRSTLYNKVFHFRINSESRMVTFASLTRWFGLQHNTIQYNTMQYNTIQYNIIQYSLFALTCLAALELNIKCMVHDTIPLLFILLINISTNHYLYTSYYWDTNIDTWDHAQCFWVWPRTFHPPPVTDAGECRFSLSIEKWNIAKHLGAGTRLSAGEEADLIKNAFKRMPSFTFPWRVFGKQRRAFSLKWLEQFSGLVYGTVPLRMLPTVCHGAWTRTWGRLTLQAQDSSLLQIQSLLYRPPGLPGKELL